MANRINVVLGLDTTAFQRSIGRVEKQLQQFGSRLESVGSELTQRLTLPMLAVGAAAVKSFADLEKLNKGLTAIMGSSDLAAEELQKLREVAKLPGLGLKEAVQGSINLQAVGLSADEARSTLFGFGKALAAVGKGKFELEAIQYQLTQMISKNKLLAEDYKVIQSNLPLMAQGMERAFGTNNIEAIRETGISAKEFTLRLSQALAAMPQTQNVTGGLSNAFENFSDNLFIAGAQMGAAINKALNLEGILSKLSTAVQRAADWFSSLNPAVQKTVVVVGLAVAAIGPLLFAIGSMAKVSALAVSGLGAIVSAAKGVGAAFTLMTGPIGIAVAAIAAVIAGVVYAYSKFEGFRKVINGLGSAIVEIIKVFKEAGSAFIEGFANLKEGEFKKAGDNFKKAFTAGIPTEFIRQYGVRVKDAFADGFADDTNYLQNGLDKIKNAIFKTQADVQNGLSASAFAPTVTPTSTPTGSTGGGGRIAPIGETAQLPTLTLPTQLDATAEAALRLAARYQTLTETGEALKAQQTGLFEKMRQDAALAAEEIQRNLESVNLGLLANGQVFVQWKTIFQDAIKGGLASFSQSIEGGIKSLKQFGNAVRNAAQQAVSALIKEGVTAVIAKTLVKLGGALGPLAIPLAAAAGSLAAGVFNSAINSIAPPRLAKGGLVVGEQVITAGDNPSGKEAIIPFERMGQFLDMAGEGKDLRVTGLFEVRGSDLVLVLDRAKQEQLRVR